MNKRLLTFTLITAIGINAYAQDCRDPNIRSAFREKFKEIGTSHPHFLKDATIIFHKSLYPKTQWIGLYWEGPIKGALLAYNCGGKLLSIQQTGGIKSIEFYNAPRSAGPTVAVEEISTGTGYYKIQYAIYSVSNEKISKLWDHTRHESNFVQPWKDGVVDWFEFNTPGPLEDGWRRITVEGIRKIYPANQSSSSDFHVEKLPTESYCWDNGKKGYAVCK